MTTHLRTLLAHATKGPWRWERVVPSCEFPEGIRDDGALTLLSDEGAVVSGAGGEGAGGAWHDLDVDDANATLIVAAINALPALLAVAEAFEADTKAGRYYCECEWSEDGNCYVHRCATHEALEKLPRSALSALNGKEQG